MANLNHRIDKIEQLITPNNMRVVWINPDETEAEAAAKAGPHAGKTLFVRWQKSDRDL